MLPSCASLPRVYGPCADEREGKGCAQQCCATTNTTGEKQQCTSHRPTLSPLPRFALYFFSWFSVIVLLCGGSLGRTWTPFRGCIFGWLSLPSNIRFVVDRSLGLFEDAGSQGLRDFSRWDSCLASIEHRKFDEELDTCGLLLSPWIIS